ncbi:MAG: NADH:ubiquinone reductase (Na(+)-transporting) subunit C [Planctomycetes bacterium]|nr:NADH:ubiquinone reductase (Na(+)-transporting) subunit C [Planctomycetota bacterium]
MVDVNSNGYTFGFAFVACVLASLLLAGANLSLKDLQDRNVKTDKLRSVLVAAGFGTSTTPAQEVEEWFKEDIKVKVLETSTGLAAKDLSADEYDPKKHPNYTLIYECIKADQECSILPVEGKGLWGKMRGYVAVGNDNNSILGLCFYDHIETPGLGAEITEPWFMENFKDNKKILKVEGDYSEANFKGVTLLKGVKASDKPKEQQAYYVDGISGATLTCNGVTEVMTTFLYENYGKYLSNRQRGIK